MPATPDLSPAALAADWKRMKTEIRPDTSNANVARVPRNLARVYDRDVTQSHSSCAEARALADALERQPVSNPAISGALTDDQKRDLYASESWRDRVATVLKEWTYPVGFTTVQDRMERAILAAFPELAPND